MADTYTHYSKLFDEDIITVPDRDKVINWTKAMLGDDPSSNSGVSVELATVHYDSAIDDALQEYSATINEWAALDNLANTFDSPGATTTGDPSNIVPITQRRVVSTFGFILKKTGKYSELVQAGGNVTEQRGYFTTVANQQHYDLRARSYSAETANDASNWNDDGETTSAIIKVSLSGSNITTATVDDWEYTFEVARTIDGIDKWVNLSPYIGTKAFNNDELTLTFTNDISNIVTSHVHYAVEPTDGWPATDKWKFTAKAPYSIAIYDEDNMEINANDLDRKKMEINSLDWHSPSTIYKYYDPYNMNVTIGAESFGFGFTAESPLFTYPVFYDILRGAQHEISAKVRKNNYSIKENNGRITIWPYPGDGNIMQVSPGNLWFDYQIPLNPYDPAELPEEGTIASLANIPYYQLKYQYINSIGRRWVHKFALASAKEILGRIRGKFTGIPVPNAEISLDAPSLIDEARGEKEDLRTSLREILEKALEGALVEAEAAEAENLQKILQFAPTPHSLTMG